MSSSWFAIGGWQPGSDFILGPLIKPRQHRLRLDHFPVGIDHLHLDVRISTVLHRSVAVLVRATLREDVYRCYWREPLKAPNLDAAEAFRSAHTEVTRGVLEGGNPDVSLGRAQLYQLALIRLLLRQIDVEIAHLRVTLEHERDDNAHRASGKVLTIHQKLVTLAKHQSAIRFRTASHIMRIVSRTELGTLRKLRKSVLGISWPLAERLLFNPLLQLGGLGAEEDFASVYPMLLHDVAKFTKINAIAVSLLRPWLPEFVQVPDGTQEFVSRPPTFDEIPGSVAVDGRLRRVATPVEFERPRLSWLDHWENLAMLLGGVAERWPQRGPWRHSGWRAFQESLIRRLYASMEDAGLVKAILASEQLMHLYPAIGVTGLARVSYAYLMDEIPRRDCLKRLEDQSDLKDPRELQVRLDDIVRSLKRTTKRDRQQTVVRVLGHYARLRRDLKTASQAMSAMARIRLIEDPEEETLSRANGLLQEFQRAGDEGPQERPIVGHVIVKADVRGSTQLTARMREAELNPAAYFSRNLYEPINELLLAYDAEKVFVEGDAVILALMEHPRDTAMPVARACGLARKILQVVNTKNDRNRHLGLPELELGIGIAYVNEPPAYLFDAGRRITISSAINRADRLSSCHADLRHADLRPDTAGQGVEVVVPRRRDESERQWGEDLIRYNVNGIELDPKAFYKLRTELKLHDLTLTLAGTNSFFTGRYPDARGKMHWLAVREAPIRSWNGDRFLPDAIDSRRFYEVVTDKTLLVALRNRLKAGRSNAPPETGHSLPLSGYGYSRRGEAQ